MPSIPIVVAAGSLVTRAGAGNVSRSVAITRAPASVDTAGSAGSSSIPRPNAIPSV
jgi:hypothetical protein